MERPFDRPPINVSATLVDGRVPDWRKDYLATVSATTDDKGRLLDSLRTGEDPTIRDGVNMALNRLADPQAPKDSMTGPGQVNPFKQSWRQKRSLRRQENRHS